MPDQPQPNQDESTPRPQGDEAGYYHDPAIRPDDSPAEPPLDKRQWFQIIPTWCIVVSVPLVLIASFLGLLGLPVLLVVALFLYIGSKSRRDPSNIFWKALGGIFGAVIAATGLLSLGFVVFVVIAFASWGSSSGK